jgi:hypothetical protein
MGKRLLFGILITTLLFAGCAKTTETTTPVSQPTQPIGQMALFKFIKTVQVTPDANFLTGYFSRINYVPATDRFVVTFAAVLDQPSGGCTNKGYGYKVYTTNMQETGESGTFACDPVDAGSVMIDNTYYHVAMAANEGQIGWHLLEIDAVSWKPLVDKFFPLDYPKEADSDPMVAYVNGQLDLSGEYDATREKPTPESGAATFHLFFSPDFQFLDKKILADTPHINGSSMIYVNNIYYFVTADAYSGDVVVIQYDKYWKYLGVKRLIQKAHWSTGLACDGQRFYLAYLNTSQRIGPGFFPVFLNVHLAAFDHDWNLLDDVAVTNYIPADNMQTGRPWVILHGNRLYVSYDLDTRDPVTHAESMKGQAIVSVYELTQEP